MRDLSATNPFQSGSELHSAYQRAYALASAHLRSHHKAMCGRVLGFMLQELPWDDGRLKMAKEVNSCSDNKKLVDLGDFYIKYFLCCFRSAKGTTPAPSEHPSRPSFDDDRDMNKDVITEASQDHRTSKHQAFKRDGYRCMLSGRLDSTVWFELNGKISKAAAASLDARDAAAAAAATPSDPELAKKAAQLEKVFTELDAAAQRAAAILESNPQRPISTNAAHIFSEPPNANLGDDKKKDCASSMWTVMARSGHQGFPDEQDGVKIHRLSNIMTLAQYLHHDFDRLELWLEAVDNQSNTYRVCSSHPILTSDLPHNPVTFTSCNDGFDLPDPRYLKMHAACCRVAQMSGAADYVNDVMDDLEKGKTKVLSEDGSGSEVLQFALLISQSMMGTEVHDAGMGGGTSNSVERFDDSKIFCI